MEVGKILHGRATVIALCLSQNTFIYIKKSYFTQDEWGLIFYDYILSTWIGAVFLWKNSKNRWRVNLK